MAKDEGKTGGYGGNTFLLVGSERCSDRLARYHVHPALSRPDLHLMPRPTLDKWWGVRSSGLTTVSGVGHKPIGRATLVVGLLLVE